MNCIKILILSLTLYFSCSTLYAQNLQSFTNSIGMTFVLIPPASFIMGSPESEKGRNWDEKLHKVEISKAYYMGIKEVTQAQWFSVMNYNPSQFKECGADCPVENVSWNDVQEFIAKLNEMEKCKAYRLPTEAEWEHACRAGSETAFFNGDITETSCLPLDPVLDKSGWYCGNSGHNYPAYGFKLQPTGLKKANAFGLYDTHGNIMEWCLDACEVRSPFSLRIGVVTDTYKDGIKDPLSRKGSSRVVRGGSYFQSPKYSRSANRSSFKANVRRSYIGFRLLRMP